MTIQNLIRFRDIVGLSTEALEFALTHTREINGALCARLNEELTVRRLLASATDPFSSGVLGPSMRRDLLARDESMNHREFEISLPI